MKTASVGLQNFLQSVMDETKSSFWYADLYTVTLKNGTVYYWSSWGLPLTVGGHTYLSFGPFLKRTSISWSTGLDNKQMKITILADLTMRIGSLSVIQAMSQDVFADATVRVDRLVMATPGDVSLGVYNLWLGPVGDIEILRGSAEITVDSGLVVLNTMTPRTVYGPSCRHTLGDANCTVNLAPFTHTGAILSGSNRFQLNTNLTPTGTIAPPAAAPTLSYAPDANSALPTRQYWVVITYTSALGETIASTESNVVIPANQVLHVASPPSLTGALGWNVYVSESPGNEQRQNLTTNTIGTPWIEPSVGSVSGAPPPLTSTSGFYALGVITFTSGVLNGLGRGIQGNAAGVLTLESGFPQAPGTGDTFIAVTGCDRTMPTCVGKFNNLVNFGGQPYIPQPENSI